MENIHLTYEEMLLLRSLRDGAKPDHDRTPDRVLVNGGFARRVDPGMIEITERGSIRATQPL